jgi:uncharacterized protein (DUF58 family)
VAVEVRPRPAVWVLLAGAGLLHLLSRATDGGWLALASGLVLALPAAAVLSRPRLADLVVRRELPSAVSLGADVDVVHVVVNQGSRWSAPLTWTDEVVGLAPVRVAVPALAPGQSARAHVVRTAVLRGVATQATATLASTAPFGLLRSTVVRTGPQSFAVHPRPVAHPPVASAAPAPGGSAPRAGSGTEVLGLRDWRAGDGASAVSARASARHGRPLVLERERDTGRSLVLLAGGRAASPAWERAVGQAAGLALSALSDGRPVLLGAHGPAGRSAVLDHLAGVEALPLPDARATERAVRAAGPGGLIVLLVPSTATGARSAAARAAAAVGCRLVVLDG